MFRLLLSIHYFFHSNFCKFLTSVCFECLAVKKMAPVTAVKANVLKNYYGYNSCSMEKQGIKEIKR